MKVPPDILGSIKTHAEETFPEECCGVVISKNVEPDNLIHVQRCTNSQDKFHALDPVQFPRTNRNAYYIDPKDLLAIDRQCREQDEQVRLIYHSHPDADAYFSEEDQRRAVIDGGPLHPGVDYLVISVRNGKCGDFKVFTWNAEARQFVE